MTREIRRGSLLVAMSGQASPSDSLRHATIAALSLATAAFTAVLFLSRSVSFERFLGSLNPLLAAALVIILGAAALRFLHSRGGFEICKGRETLRGAALAAGIATLLAVPVIALDLRTPFPRDLNIPPPQSLLFYPAMAYIAEISFHALPLSLLLILLGAVFRHASPHRLAWSSILLTSLLEPAYQVLVGAARPLSWVDAFVGLHVFAFNMLQLYVFRRFDFLSMYSFRLTYYLCWHILWGWLRLRVLF